MFNCLLTFELYLDDPQGLEANCGNKTVISSLRWYASDRYGLLIMVGGVAVVGCVGGDFSQTGQKSNAALLIRQAQCSPTLRCQHRKQNGGYVQTTKTRTSFTSKYCTF